MRVYRASSLGYSLEALVAPHLGYEPVAAPDFLQAAYDEGTRLEPIILDRLRDDDWEIQDRQEEVNAVGDHQIEVELPILPDVIVRGHLDGLKMNGEAAEAVIEAKSMNARTWQTFQDRGWETPGLVQKYKWQCSVYMITTGLPLKLVAWNKDTEEIHIEAANGPFYSFVDVAKRVNQAELYVAAGTLPEGCTDYPCPFFHLHAPSDNPVEAADKELEHLLEQWLSLDNHEKAYKKEKDAIRGDILAITGTEGLANVRGSNGVTVTVTWQDEKEYTTKRKEGWVTRISAPRRGNVAK